MGKNWHGLSVEAYVTVDAMLEIALDSVRSVGMDSVNVRKRHMIDEYIFGGDDAEDGGALDGECDAECS